DLAATVHAPVRAAELERLGGLEGLERAGEWVFARAWLDELGVELEARIDRADPLDPGIAPPAEPWAPAVVPLLPFERRGAKLYRPGAAAELGAREAEARRVEAELGLDPVKVEERQLARYLEEQGGLGHVG